MEKDYYYYFHVEHWPMASRAFLSMRREKRFEVQSERKNVAVARAHDLMMILVAAADADAASVAVVVVADDDDARPPFVLDSCD